MGSGPAWLFPFHPGDHSFHLRTKMLHASLTLVVSPGREICALQQAYRQKVHCGLVRRAQWLGRCVSIDPTELRHQFPVDWNLCIKIHETIRPNDSERLRSRHKSVPLENIK